MAVLAPHLAVAGLCRGLEVAGPGPLQEAGGEALGLGGREREWPMESCPQGTLSGWPRGWERNPVFRGPGERLPDRLVELRDRPGTRRDLSETRHGPWKNLGCRLILRGPSETFSDFFSFRFL